MSLGQLEKFHQWRLQRLPELATPQGIEIFIWLLKNGHRSSSVTSLYRGSRFSEPTIRKYLNAFVAAGYVDIEPDSGDTRRHLIQATAKLHELAGEYRAWIALIALEEDGYEVNRLQLTQ